MTVLLDNKGQGKVGDALAKSIEANARLAILSGLFSVYGYSALKKQLVRAGALRLLIPSNDSAAVPGEGQPFKETQFNRQAELNAKMKEMQKQLQKKAAGF
ncbi:MAG: hypothetical protein KAW17_02930 [Candidatus Eisenbacteria sp.]|nr:hypothetical protein [Candidatus Eisenbacteria bacterium]